MSIFGDIKITTLTYRQWRRKHRFKYAEGSPKTRTHPMIVGVAVDEGCKVVAVTCTFCKEIFIRELTRL